MQQSLIVITGMSGSGKSVAIKALEDSGYFCADNMPVVLLPQFLELIQPHQPRIAVVVDIRQPGFSDNEGQLLELLSSRTGLDPQLLFLDCDDQTLIRRFSQSRRPHPLSEQDIGQGIELERSMLQRFRQAANLIIDTSQLAPHDFRLQIRSTFSPTQDNSQLKITVVSFGFKHGLPLDIDLLFDMRFLPNPYWVETLRSKSGRDPEIGAYLREQDGMEEMLAYIQPMLLFLIRKYQHSDRHYLKIAFGCTGGRHRSVYTAEQIHAHLSGEGIDAFLLHRDIDLVAGRG